MSSPACARESPGDARGKEENVIPPVVGLIQEIAFPGGLYVIPTWMLDGFSTGVVVQSRGLNGEACKCGLCQNARASPPDM